MIIGNHPADDFLRADEDDEIPGPGQGGIEQIPGQEHGGPAGDGHDDDRELAALGLMDREAVSLLQILQVAGFIDDLLLLIKKNGEGMAVGIDSGHKPDVPVEDAGAFFPRGAEFTPGNLIIIPGLDYLVAETEDDFPPGKLGFVRRGRVERLLEEEVEAVDAAVPLAGRGQHLNIADGTGGGLCLRITEISGEAPRDEGGDGAGGIRDGGLALKEEVSALFIQDRHFAGIDEVGIQDNPALTGLAVDLRKADTGDLPAVQDIAEDVAGADAGQLIRITDEDQAGARLDGAEEGAHERKIDHGGFIGDDAVRLNGILLIAGKDAFITAVLEEAVNRAGFGAGGLGHALGGAAGGRAQDGLIIGRKELQNTVDDGGFAGSRTAGDHENAVFQGAADRLALGRGEGDGPLLLKGGNRPEGAGIPVRPDGSHQLPEAQGHLLLRPPVKGQVNPAVLPVFIRFPLQGAGNQERAQGPGAEIGRDLQEGGGGSAELLFREINMTGNGGGIPQDVFHGAADPAVTLRRDAEGETDAVRRFKADAFQIIAETVRILANDFRRTVSVEFADFHGKSRGDAVGLEKDDGPAGTLLLLKAFSNHGGTLFPNAFHLGQAIRMLGKNGQGFLPEDLDNEGGGGGTDPADEAAAKVPLDAEEGGGRFQLTGTAAELPPVSPVLNPVTGENSLLPGRKLRQGTDHRQLIAAGADSYNGPTVFLIAENGADDRRFELVHVPSDWRGTAGTVLLFQRSGTAKRVPVFRMMNILFYHRKRGLSLLPGFGIIMTNAQKQRGVAEMDMMKTLLIYLTATMALAVQSTSAPKETPVPTPEPTAIVETVAPDGEETGTDSITAAPKKAETPAPAAEATKKPTPAPVPTITPNLKSYHNLGMGSKGKDVKKLQEKLIEMKYLPEDAADGAYGRQTYNAVKKFQYYNGLKQDGVAGRATQTNLFENPDVVPNPEAKEETPTPEATPEATPGPETTEPAETGEGTQKTEAEDAESELTAVPPELLDKYMNIGETEQAGVRGASAEKATEEPTEEPAEEPAEEVTEAPTEQPTEAPTEEPAEEVTEEPTEKPTEAPTKEPEEEETEEPAEEVTAEPEEEPAEEPTAEPEEEREEIIENVDLDAEEYETIIGSVALNESNGPLEFIATEDGVPVTAKPRLMQNGAKIRVSLDDLCQCAEGWELTDDGVGSIVLEAAGYTLAIYNEESGCSASVDGTEIEMKDDDLDFSTEGHFINAEFLARALKGEAVWEPEESTLMLRIKDKNDGTD